MRKLFSKPLDKEKSEELSMSWKKNFPTFKIIFSNVISLLQRTKRGLFCRFFGSLREMPQPILTKNSVKVKRGAVST
jgi:hypothetical protein